MYVMQDEITGDIANVETVDQVVETLREWFAHAPADYRDMIEYSINLIGVKMQRGDSIVADANALAVVIEVEA